MMCGPVFRRTRTNASTAVNVKEIMKRLPPQEAISKTGREKRGECEQFLMEEICIEVIFWWFLLL